jgi:hypothetical protein
LDQIKLIDFMVQNTILITGKNMDWLLTKLQDNNFFHKNYWDNDRLDPS